MNSILGFVISFEHVSFFALWAGLATVGAFAAFLFDFHMKRNPERRPRDYSVSYHFVREDAVGKTSIDWTIEGNGNLIDADRDVKPFYSVEQVSRILAENTHQDIQELLDAEHRQLLSYNLEEDAKGRRRVRGHLDV